MKKISFTNESFIYEILALKEEKYGRICNGAYTIGRHSIIGPKNPEIGKQIMDNGLKIASGSSLYTVTPLGRIDRNEVYSLLNQNIEWMPKDSWSSGVVTAIPVMLNTKDNRCIYLGEITNEYDSDKYNSSSIMDNYFRHKHIIDSEFILGYFEKGENGTIEFVFNENFIAFKDEEYQNNFVDRLLDYIKNYMYNPLLDINMDEEKLKELKSRLTSSDFPLKSNYILKTILQLENEKNYFSKLGGKK